MYIRKKVEVVCSNCKISFNKDVSEVNRNIKLKRKNYCSLNCSGISNTHNLPKEGNINNLNSSNRIDKYTEVRSHLRRAKTRTQQCTINVEYLLEVWDFQLGICPYSKVKLLHPSRHHKNNPIFTSSLDRIDSSLGYIEGNIQFISMAMNLMKYTMSHEQVIELLNIIKRE